MLALAADLMALQSDSGQVRQPHHLRPPAATQLRKRARTLALRAAATDLHADKLHELRVSQAPALRHRVPAAAVA